MNADFSALTLLAQYSKWQRLGDGLHRSKPRAELSDLLPIVIIMGIIALAIAVGVQLYKRHDYSKPCDDPRKLFRQLCSAHKLNFSSRRLLLQLASALEMQHPATVFVTPSAFRVSELPPKLQAQQAALQALAKKLF